jgi:hypothetical protein
MSFAIESSVTSEITLSPEGSTHNATYTRGFYI